MKQVVAIQAFAGMLARQSGYTADFCERFVIEMFKTVADALKESNRVNIKGLGRFLVNDSGDVEFEPDDVFAAEVNAPFDCFEPELLDDYATDEILSLDGDGNKTDGYCGDDSDVVGAVAAEATDDAVGSGAACVDNVDDKPDTKDECIDPNDTVCGKDEAPAEISGVTDMEVVQDTEVFPDGDKAVSDVEHQSAAIGDNGIDHVDPNYEKETNAGRAHSLRWFMAGIAVGAVFGAVSAYFMTKSCLDEKMSPSVVQSPAETEAIMRNGDGCTHTEPAVEAVVVDTITVQEAMPEMDSGTDAVVYDNVTSTLAQLSRKHYGSYEFWVYIYEENRDVIADPNRVEPQTRVRIPSPEKYGIDAKDKASIKAALKKSQELAR